MHIFVISLKDSKSRRDRINGRLAELGLRAEVFDAIDARSTPDAKLEYSKIRRRLFYGKGMTAGEVGCARSHLAVCAEIVRRGLECALILEDDALLLDDLPQALRVIEGLRERWDIIRFLGKPKHVRRSRIVRHLEGELTLRRLYGTPAGAYGYVVNKQAAERLLHLGRALWAPIDVMHGQVWRHRLRAFCVAPSPILPDFDVESTIGESRFEKSRKLVGIERLYFPLTRLAFKISEMLMKQIFYFGAVAADYLESKSIKPKKENDAVVN